MGEASLFPPLSLCPRFPFVGEAPRSLACLRLTARPFVCLLAADENSTLRRYDFRASYITNLLFLWPFPAFDVFRVGILDLDLKWCLRWSPPDPELRDTERRRGLLKGGGKHVYRGESIEEVHMPSRQVARLPATFALDL